MINIKKLVARLLGQTSDVRPQPGKRISDFGFRISEKANDTPRRRRIRDMGIFVARLQVEMDRHIGKHNAIGMGELYEIVFKKPWHNRINDTRMLRSVISELQWQGAVICSYCSGDGKGGYYKPSAGSEMEDYLRRLRKRALKILAREAKMRRISLPELLGQVELDFPGGFDEAA